MKPEYGARFTLRLTQTEPDVGYSFDVEMPGGRSGQNVSGEARVNLADGVVTLEGPELPPWLSTTMTGLLRSLWRARRGEPAEPWPRRLTRWRRAEGARVE